MTHTICIGCHRAKLGVTKNDMGGTSSSHKSANDLPDRNKLAPGECLLVIIFHRAIDERHVKQSPPLPVSCPAKAFRCQFDGRLCGRAERGDPLPVTRMLHSP